MQSNHPLPMYVSHLNDWAVYHTIDIKMQLYSRTVCTLKE